MASQRWGRRDWFPFPTTEFAYNNSKNRSTGKSPFEVVYGRAPPLILDRLSMPHPTTYDQELYSMVRALWKFTLSSFESKAQHTCHLVALKGSRRTVEPWKSSWNLVPKWHTYASKCAFIARNCCHRFSFLVRVRSSRPIYLSLQR